jgi:hypothetical protein
MYSLGLSTIIVVKIFSFTFFKISAMLLDREKWVISFSVSSRVFSVF